MASFGEALKSEDGSKSMAVYEFGFGFEFKLSVFNFVYEFVFVFIVSKICWYYCHGEFTKSFIFGTVNVVLKNPIK